MDVGRRAQEAAEKHLAECWEAYYASEEEPDPAKWPESPACAPFCGCETCLVREVLHAAWPILEEEARKPRPLALEDDIYEHENPGPPRHDRIVAASDDWEREPPPPDEL